MNELQANYNKFVKQKQNEQTQTALKLAYDALISSYPEIKSIQNIIQKVK